MTDPYIAYEEYDPETGETVARGETQQSIIDRLISEGKPFRIVKVLSPDPQQ